jgi:hypothetical protein
MEIDKLIEDADTVRYIKAQRIKWLGGGGHIQRTNPARPTRKLFDWKPVGTKSVGRQRLGETGIDWERLGKTWRDWKRLGETWRDWKRLGETGRDWKRLGETGRDLTEKAKTHRRL